MVQENQRGYFGIIIPKNVLEDTELNIAEKFVYGYIASFTRCCFESNETIARKIGVSESTVKHAIPKLAKKGFLFIEKTNNNDAARRIYSVLDNPKKLAYLAKRGMFKAVENSREEVCKNCTGGVQNMHSGVQNMHTPKTEVRCAKYAHIDKEYNKNKEKTEPKRDNTLAGLAGERPASQLAMGPNKPKISDYPNARCYLSALREYRHKQKVPVEDSRSAPIST